VKFKTQITVDQESRMTSKRGESYKNVVQTKSTKQHRSC